MARSNITVRLEGPLFEPGRQDAIRAEMNKEIRELVATGHAMTRLRFVPGRGYKTGRFWRSIKIIWYSRTEAWVVPTNYGEKRWIIQGRTLEKRFGHFRRSAAELARRQKTNQLAERIAERLNG